MEFQLPVHEILFTIPERWRYLFSMFNVFSTDGAGLDIIRAQGYITYNFKEALMTDWRGWYVLLMFMPLMMIYIFQIGSWNSIYISEVSYTISILASRAEGKDETHPISNLLSILIFHHSSMLRCSCGYGHRSESCCFSRHLPRNRKDITILS